ncbi:MAG: tRNA (adenosine(37)-N6)-threonylcarbamoyltransferase complex ATPase subunit type 1 TsaE [Chitinophagales bacterium]|jgi:tRNA threonylcarbamoyladenosine biosynthesis protein TsaE|nr:tRNA (adenosine(37)-N6)-threonylcarbamoyltransferase complex ATPase subunit type 1 TsaE [Chitinophagales bacterium]
MQLKIHSIAELPAAASQLINTFINKRIFAFSGEMGTGKTALIIEICRLLGVREQISSPTYAIINEYEAEQKIFHIDLYRLTTIDEALDIGIEEYLVQNHYCFIEWPQLIQPLLPPETVYVNIEAINENERLLTIKIR